MVSYTVGYSLGYGIVIDSIPKSGCFRGLRFLITNCLLWTNIYKPIYNHLQWSLANILSYILGHWLQIWPIYNQPNYHRTYHLPAILSPRLGWCWKLLNGCPPEGAFGESTRHNLGVPQKNDKNPTWVWVYGTWAARGTGALDRNRDVRKQALSIPQMLHVWYIYQQFTYKITKM